MTLVELLVVLAILAVATVVVAPAVRDPARATTDPYAAAVATVRHQAIEGGRLVQETIRLGGDTIRLTATPSGVVHVDSAGTERTLFIGSLDVRR